MSKKSSGLKAEPVPSVFCSEERVFFSPLRGSDGRDNWN